jgi:probable rRNA maturation factor
MNIELTNLSGRECDELQIRDLASFTLDKLGIHPDSELSISLVDEDEMSTLHMQWMDEPGPTDVLSFPMDEMKPNSSSNGPGLLGDIVLCPAFAELQAKNAGHSLQSELELLTVHGILHLLGFDHREAEEEKVMFGLQEKYLKEWRASA